MAKENFLDKILGIFGLARKKAADFPLVAGAGLGEFGIGGGRISKAKLLASNKNWIFACVRARAEAVGNIKLRLFEVGKDRTEQEIFEHELLDLLAAVNPFMSQFELFESLSSHLDLCGNAYWYLDGVKDYKDKPAAIYPLNPKYIEIKKGKLPNFIEEYRYRVGGKNYTFNPAQILHFRIFNPDDPTDGLGILESILDWIEADDYATEWNKVFFKNAARPDAILEHETELTEEQIKILKASFEEVYRGVERAHKTLILPRGIKFSPVGWSQKEMDFVEMQRMTRDKILAAFRVPKTVLGITEDVNRCYSEDTEVLTENGFKKYFEVQKNEKIATVNPLTNTIEYHKPTKRFVYDYRGEMIEIKNLNVSILVTPNHKIWRRTDKKEYSFINAENLEKRIYFKASFNNKNNYELKEVIIPSVKAKKGANKLARVEEIRCNADDFLEYLGYFLSEGGLLKNTSPNFRYVHTLSQKKGEKADKIDRCLQRLPFSYKKYINKDGVVRWNVYGKNLNLWLKENCGDGCENKHILPQFKNLSKRQLKILFDALMLGDGSWDKRKNRTNGYYSTTSSRLADDVQEIALKLGYSASKAIAYKKTKKHRTCYVVHLSKRKEHSVRNAIKKVNYTGKVWCFEVPNHIFITRRDGKITAQGNSNAEASSYVFALRVVRPQMERIVGYLNEFLVPRYGDNIFLDFEDPVPENRELELQENKISLAGRPYASVNEIREKEGLPPIEGGDSVMIDFSVVPLGKPIESKKAELRTKTSKKPSVRFSKNLKKRKEIAETIAREAKKVLSGDIKEILKAYDEEKWEAAWKAFVVRVTPYEKALIEKVKKFNKEQKERVLENLDKIATKQTIKEAKNRSGEKIEKRLKQEDEEEIDYDDLLDKKKENLILIAMAMPILKELFKKEGNEALKLIGAEETFNVHTERIKNALEKRIGLMAKNYNETTLNLLKEKLKEGLVAGESLAELTERVKQIYEFSDEVRAARVARTESFTVANLATKEAWRQSGVVKSLRWFTALDERVCEFCEPMNGKIIGIDEKWFEKGDVITGKDGGEMEVDYSDIEAPALHPNCRCYIRAEEISIE